jgi:hypothetical protein
MLGSKSKTITISLLVISVLLSLFLPCQGCKEEEKQGEELALVVPKMTLVKRDIIDEDSLKRELEIVHPVIPPDKQSRYQLYVTPSDSAVSELAAQINGARDAYQTAVQWIWVSEETLNQVAEKWLMPNEFLTNTPRYPNNPVKGEVVSDCEEQANTLVSLLRAEGIRPEEARVVLGKVEFGDEEGGHAWVELMSNGHWLALEPTTGPYWDDEAGELVSSQGAPFDYYATHTYPVIQVWAYYNDIYYFDPRNGSGNAPDSWRKVALAN